jgi:hypothetical protein
MTSLCTKGAYNWQHRRGTQCQLRGRGYCFISRSCFDQDLSFREPEESGWFVLMKFNAVFNRIHHLTSSVPPPHTHTHLHPRVRRSPTPGYICYPCVSSNILWERNPPPVSNILPLIIIADSALLGGPRHGRTVRVACAVSCRSRGGQEPI